MATTGTFLSSVVNRLKAFFTKAAPVATAITADAVKLSPVVDAALIGAGQPAVAALYNVVSASAMKVEIAAAAAGAQTGTGTQKLAAVVADPDVQAAFATFEGAAGVSQHTISQQTAYADLVAQTMNILNQTPAAPAPAPALQPLSTGAAAQ